MPATWRRADAALGFQESVIWKNLNEVGDAGCRSVFGSIEGLY